MYCILRDNKELRAAIEYRIKSLGLQKGDVAKMAGVSLPRFSAYMNEEYQRKGKGTVSRTITQERLLKICRGLGIHVELKISLT